MGMEQMMTSDDNGGRSVKKELIYNGTTPYVLKYYTIPHFNKYISIKLV
jgi:hypothetical protein